MVWFSAMCRRCWVLSGALCQARPCQPLRVSMGVICAPIYWGLWGHLPCQRLPNLNLALHDSLGSCPSKKGLDAQSWLLKSTEWAMTTLRLSGIENIKLHVRRMSSGSVELGFRDVCVCVCWASRGRCAYCGSCP